MIKILQGDVRAMLKTLPAESVHCVVTSPPYWGLRCYGVDGQLGLEPTMAEHIDTMVDVFREVRRVLRKDGTVWLNYGDCYATAPNGRSAADTKATGNDDRTFRDKPFSTVGGTLKPKDLCMIPNRLAIALQDDGWWVRSEIIWAKPNPMPESVTDRPATAHEKVWLLSKAARYFYDAEAVRTEAKGPYTKMPDGWDTTVGEGGHGSIHKRGRDKGRKNRATFRGGSYVNNQSFDNSSDMSSAGVGSVENTAGANLRNVWTIPTKGFAEAHFATFPPNLAETCIKAGTSEKGCCAECGAPWVRDVERVGAVKNENYGKTKIAATHQGGITSTTLNSIPAQSITLGWSPSCECVDSDGNPPSPVPATVLDPFIGSGTTAMVADRLQRDCIGIDLNSEYAEMAIRRIKDDAGMFAEVS